MSVLVERPKDGSSPSPAEGEEGHISLRQLLRRAGRRPEAGAFVVAVVLYIFFVTQTTGTGFASLTGTESWLNPAAELGIIAMPIGLLLIAGEFDLSIGSMVGASGMVVAIGSAHYHLPLVVVVLLAIALGVGVGLINGLLVVRTSLPSFIVTLAANFVLAGVALGLSSALTGTSTVSFTAHGIVKSLFGSSAGQGHVAILWWAAVAAVSAWVLSQTRAGNWIFATGGNGDTARAAGVPVARVKVSLFVFAAVASAIVGVIQAVEFQSGNATNGQGFVFEAPIVCVIGGVLLSGGYGSAIGILLGTITYGVIQSGIFYAGWDSSWLQAFLGLLLLLAVLANNLFRRLALSAVNQRRG
ncbi:MAG: ABC transporter permease [Solirubrobacterales bacterium]